MKLRKRYYRVADYYFRRIDYVNVLIGLRDKQRLVRFLNSPERELLTASPGEAMITGQVTLIHALMAVGDTTAAHSEANKLDSYLTERQLDHIRPNWEELLTHPAAKHNNKRKRA